MVLIISVFVLTSKEIRHSLLYFCSLGFALVDVLVAGLCVQVAQIVRGQTRYERKRGVLMYDNGLMCNIRAVFGERWYVAWICPWIKSPLPEDGARFRVSELKTK